MMAAWVWWWRFNLRKSTGLPIVNNWKGLGKRVEKVEKVKENLFISLPFSFLLSLLLELFCTALWDKSFFPLYFEKAGLQRGFAGPRILLFASSAARVIFLRFLGDRYSLKTNNSLFQNSIQKSFLTEIKDIGVIFDKKLSFSDHIN